MPQYLLSTYGTPSATPEPPPPMTDEEMQQSMADVMRLQAKMREAGAFVFGGRLHAPDTSSVIRQADGSLVTTDGPFLESKEHLGGFYIIEAEDLDAALDWAGQVVDCVHASIEVRPFFHAET